LDPKAVQQHCGKAKASSLRLTANFRSDKPIVDFARTLVAAHQYRMTVILLFPRQAQTPIG
jgi:hypothetical protein